MSGEPLDPRFSLANERTYLAWIRTSLGLVASGVAVERFLPVLVFRWVRPAIGILLVGVGALSAALAHSRWRKVEAALKAGEDIPAPRFAQAVAGAIAVAGVAIIVLLIWNP